MNDIVKGLLIGFVFFIVFFAIPLVFLFPSEFSTWINHLTGNNWKGTSIDFKKFIQSPENYSGKYVAATGTFSISEEFYMNCNMSVSTLSDEDDLKIKICVDKKDFKVGQVYTVKGVIMEDISELTASTDYILKVDPSL